jgi:peptidoglycan/LPS O-acetylase OafA/YrhL
LVYLGKISYGLYLWHMPVLLSLKPIFGARPGILLAWVLVLSVAMASLSWHGFEKHLAQGPGGSKG